MNATHIRSALVSSLILLTLSPIAAEPPASLAALRNTEFGEPVVRGLELLIEKGTDRYGPEQTPLWMAVLDARTVEAPREPQAADENVRVIRRGRRAPGGVNFYHDQSTLRVAYALSLLSGDGKFRAAADAYLREAMRRCVKPDSGLFVWGWHTWYDAFAERFQSQSGDWHETHLWLPDWERMYRLDPAAVVRQAQAVWRLHVCDKATGEFNRHSDGKSGLAFSMTGGQLIYAFSEMARLTGESVWKDRAHKISDWHWSHRNPETNLTVNVPGGERFDGKFCDSAVIGLHAGQTLLAAYRSPDALLQERALAYLNGYAQYGYSDSEGGFYGMVEPDGSPLLKWESEGYDQYAKPGLLDLWEVYVIGYAYPLPTAQIYAYALRDGGGPEIRAAAERWAEWIARELPANQGRGTYADQYGRCISFFLEMARHTGDSKYHALAVEIGRDALAKLDTGALLKSHPHKPYSEAVDGRGVLLHALLELALNELHVGYDFGFNM